VAGIVAGSIFQLTQWAYIHFQVGVSSYNAIYGSFAALPLFLMWMQISWLIVLFGAVISYAHHNIELYEFETEISNISPYAKRIISLLIVHRIVLNFKNGELPGTTAELSNSLKLPVKLVRTILNDLIRVNLVSEVILPKKNLTAYQPSINIDFLTVKFVTDKLDHFGQSSIIDTSLEKACRLVDIHNSFTISIQQHPDNVLLKDI
jgi:membrane protein